jgi:urease accessory protein UreF
VVRCRPSTGPRVRPLQVDWTRRTISASELGASQISTLLEALPGIANVLRSPVADALLNVIRAAAKVGEFQLADAEELIRYATRRGLVGNDEGERVLAEVRETVQRRADKAAEKERDKVARDKTKLRPKPKAAAKKPNHKKKK